MRCLVAFFCTLMAAVIHVSAIDYVWHPERCKGQDSVDVAGVFVTHRMPAKYQCIENCHLFNVSVGGADVALYDDHNVWGGRLNFGSFEFADGKTVEIVITSREPVETYELLPRSVQCEVVDASAGGFTLRMSRADQKVTLIINGNARTGNVLHLFCNSIDPDDPRPDIRSGYVHDQQHKLHYFAAGYHDVDAMFGGKLTITGDERIYVAAGAVVRGCLGIEHGRGASITGRGMVFADTQTRGGMMLSVNHSTGCTVEGLTFHRHAKDGWQTGLGRSDHITFSNLNIVSGHYASTDGIDVCNSQDCLFDNCFVRAADDAIAIKGLEKGEPAQCAPCENLTFTRMQLWNDCNNAFGMGAETRAAVYQNIRLLDSDILFSYDDPDFHGQLDERAAINICSLHGTWFRNILIENLHIYHCQRFVGLAFKPSFWFGVLPGDQSTPGGIDGVTLRNIQCHSDPGSSIAGEVRIMGWRRQGTPDKLIQNIVFDGVYVDGEHLSSPSWPRLVTNNTPHAALVKNLVFR